MIADRKKLFDSFTVTRQWPKNIANTERNYFQHEIRRSFPRADLVTFRNVFVSGEGVVFNFFRTFLPSLPHPEFEKDYGFKYRLINLLKRKKIKLPDRKYLLISNAWTFNYFHWFLDAMPRLIAIEDQCSEWTLLLPDNHQAGYIQACLGLFQFKGIEYFPANAYVSLKELIMPEHIVTTGNFNPSVMKSMRERLLRLASFEGLEKKEDYRKIYVSRKRAQFRYVLNEAEVEAEMTARGFKIICFEDYTFRQQIAMMSCCSYFAGIIGSNLVNMMFMPENGKVLQFTQKENGNDNCYFSLASVFQLDFYCQFCEFVDTRPGAYWNLSVDILKMKDNLNLMLK
jgi:capsular polysaccharide biosynthesis protein